jgi:hypothetical protein
MMFKFLTAGVLAMLQPSLSDNLRTESTAAAWTEGELVNFINTDLFLEPFIPYSDFFENSPLDKYTAKKLTKMIEKGVDVAYSAGASPSAGISRVFDMTVRNPFNGLTTAYRITSDEIKAQTGLDINTDAEMSAYLNANWQIPAPLWEFLGSPALLMDVYWLSSPGLPAGEWRSLPAGALQLREVLRTARQIPAATSCIANPQTDPLMIFVEVLGNRFIEFKEGNEVYTLTDPLGNVYYLGGLRSGPSVQPLVFFVNYFNAFNGNDPSNMWTFSGVAETVTEDFTVNCLHSSFVPENNNGNEPIVCKQLQVFVGGRNTFVLAKMAKDAGGNPVGLPPLFVTTPNAGCSAYDIMGSSA